MCGIAGFCLHPDEHNIDTPKLARELLLNIEIRGRDATGAAWYEGDTLMVQKDGMKASHFVKWCDLPLGATNVILHTRMGTKGTEKDNNNNHPVVAGNIVGVHNGMCYNDDYLFKRMGLTEYRVGEVDTEAIFAAIAYGMQKGEDGKPRLFADIRNIMEEIEGSAAIAWLEIEGDPNIMHLARISSSPLVLAETKGGSLIFASTEEAIRKAVRTVQGVEVDTVSHAKEGTLFTVRNGTVIEGKTFSPPWSRYTDWENYSFGSGKTTFVTSSGKKDKPKTDPVVRAVHALSPPAKKDDDKDDKDDNGQMFGFQKYLSHYALHAHVLADLVQEESLEVMDDELIVKEYRFRCDAIKRYIDKFGLEDAAEHGCELRPGTWVTTYIGTEYENVDAQVWTMPQKFPGGTYLLRAMVPNSRYRNKYEAVLVERMWGEFEYISEVMDEIIGDLDDGDILHPRNDGDELDADDPRIREDDEEHMFHVEQDDKGEIATFECG